MLTIIETPVFKREADLLWSEDERGEFCAWLAERPDVGDVIKGSGGTLVAQRNGKTRRRSSDLFQQKSTARNMAVDDICQK